VYKADEKKTTDELSQYFSRLEDIHILTPVVDDVV